MMHQICKSLSSFTAAAAHGVEKRQSKNLPASYNATMQV
jgi:hypothetical protein